MTIDEVCETHGGARRRIFAGWWKSVSVAFLLLAVVSAPAAGSSEVSAEMVLDIGVDNSEQSSNPRWFVRAGNEVYFSATTPALGRELYATDGVTPRVALDLVPGPTSSNASLLGLAGTRLVVEAEDGSRGNAVSVVDPASGAITRLIDAVPVSGPEARRAKPIAQLGARMLFAIDGERALWGSDGTLAGTQRLFAQTHPEIEKFTCSVDGKVLFPMAVSGGGHSLWRSDGSVAGTTAFATMPDEWQIHSQTRGGAYCYFLFNRADGWSLWRSDGMTASLVMSKSGAAPQRAVATPTTAYAIDRIGTNLRLWRDGVAAPVTMVPDSFGTVTAYAVDEYVVMVATILENGFGRDAIFRSDGTAAGTRRLTVPPELWSFQSAGYGAVVGRTAILVGNGNFAAVDPAVGSVVRPEKSGNILLGNGDYATLDTAVISVGYRIGWGGWEVWRTDATEAGTRVLHDIWMGTSGGSGYLAVPFDSHGHGSGRPVVADDDVLYFTVAASAPWTRVWRTDGTAAGTFPISGFADGDALWNVRSGERVLFASTNARNLIYRTDPGSHESASPVAHDWLGSTLAATPNGMAAVYSCGIVAPSTDLCGLGPTGRPILLLNDAEDNQSTRVAGSLGNALLLLLGSTRSSPEVRGLWRSDGTLAGTAKLSGDLFYPFLPQFASRRQHGRLYFNAQSTATQQHGLYVSDGTAAGTALVAGLSYPVRRMVSLGADGLMFVSGADSSPELWYSDGTTSGTYLLRTFPNSSIEAIDGVGAFVHFIVAGQNSRDYYVSDGSAGGTNTVALPSGWSPQNVILTRLDDDTAGFNCNLPGFGTEFCAIDADGGNPRLVREIFPGPTGSIPQFLGVTRNAVYITADDGYNGRELWRVTTHGGAIFAEDFEDRYAP
ncbi:MAG TPA: hypothetical protein VN153_11010 [Tahibacter sp.]|nr:hypothetical protein [Tahibacter sp.]